MAKRDLVPIKVTLGLRKNGQIDWPDFGKISTKARLGLEWSRFIDQCGIQWHYDRINNIGNGSERDIACTLVPEDFAEEAAQMFESVEVLTEEEFEKWHDECATCHLETEMLDTEVLQGILARIQLEEKGVAPPPSDEIRRLRKEALDPNHLRPGIRRNPQRHWREKKRHLNVGTSQRIDEIRNRVQRDRRKP